MAVIYSLALRNARMQAVVDAIGDGGKLVILDADEVVLASADLATPAGTVANGVLTFAMPSVDLSADDSGPPAEARIRTSADADVVSGLTVGMSNADVIMNVPTITGGQKLTINSATISHF